jgi:hypothetical protein
VFDAIALGANGVVYRFTTDAPQAATTTTVTTGGLAGGAVDLVGIDYRPSDGLLYGASTNNKLYTIAPGLLTGLVASSERTLEPAGIDGTGQGFDFNPASNIMVDGSGNALRIIGYSDGANLRFNPTNGKRLAADTSLTFLASDVNTGKTPKVTGSAYTDNVPGTAATKLYNLESATDSLVVQSPPNEGSLATVAPLGIDVGDLAGFDIATVIGTDAAVTNYAFAVIGDSFYAVDLTSGTGPAAKLVGKVKGASALRGLAIALKPN